MTGGRGGEVTLEEVIARVEEELHRPPDEASTLRRCLDHARELQRVFREQPVGGRLSGLKRLVVWFTASTFDRQAKAVEATLDLCAQLLAEQERLQKEIDRLWRALDRSGADSEIG